MTLYLRLYWEFFKTGLFAIGGGMATLPFLKDIGATTGWFTQTDLMNMLAVSESTPGPVGINMATYVGYTVAGVPGAIIATIGEVTPSIVVILIVAAMLAKFRDSKAVADAFYGLRPASTGLIGAACAGVMLQVIAGITSASAGESLLIGDQIKVTVVSVEAGGRVRLAIDAPRSMTILRSELRRAMDANQDAAREEASPMELLGLLTGGPDGAER